MVKPLIVAASKATTPDSQGVAKRGKADKGRRDAFLGELKKALRGKNGAASSETKTDDGKASIALNTRPDAARPVGAGEEASLGRSKKRVADVIRAAADAEGARDSRARWSDERFKAKSGDLPGTDEELSNVPHTQSVHNVSDSVVQKGHADAGLAHTAPSGDAEIDLSEPIQPETEVARQDAESNAEGVGNAAARVVARSVGYRRVGASGDNRVSESASAGRKAAKGAKRRMLREVSAGRNADSTSPALRILTPETRPETGKPDGSSQVRDIVINLAGTGDANSGVSREMVAAAPAEHLTSLAARLRSDVPAEVVRQAQIMLRDGDSAEIRLVIRPPELGRVRIQLNVDNGHIAGRILVDNGSVRDLVEQNLGQLQREFEAQGLQVGQFDVESREDRDGKSGFEKSPGERVKQTAAAEQFDGNTVRANDRYYENLRVNIVA